MARVLVACEESQVVCKAFRAAGHEAYSCDIQSCSGGHPEWHIQDNVLRHLDGWDLIIAHPPCTFISNAGARWLWSGGQLNAARYSKGLAAVSFFRCFLHCRCERVAIENPLPSRIYNLPKPTQIIQPYQFGEPWAKRTLLWLKGLPPLVPTNVLDEYLPYCSSGSYSKNHDKRYTGFSRVGGSARVRSRTFPGVAAAMVSQWGPLL